MSTGRSTSLREFRRDASGIEFGTDDGAQKVNPSSVVAKFEAAADSGQYTETLPPLDLPGHGKRDEECGDEIPRFCADCGHTCTCGRTCYRSACPRCWKGWARRRATAISAKIEALRKYKEASEGAGWQGYKFHHVVLSPPDGYAMDSKEPLDRTFEVIKEVLTEMGVSTGALFYHPYRGEDGDDRGFWKDLLPDGTETNMAATRQELQHEDEQHFHAIVLAKFVPGQGLTKQVEHETGWLIKRITKGGDESDSNVSLRGKYDLARAVSYCLSHTGIDRSSDRSKAAYRYFGEVANFSAEEHIEREMDAAVRSVATRTLGLDYDSLTCVIERERVVETTIERHVEKVNPDGAGEGVGVPEVEVIEETIEELEEQPCQGRLLEIRKAPAFLDDEEWMSEAEHADQLEAAWAEWREEIDGEPPD